MNKESIESLQVNNGYWKDNILSIGCSQNTYGGVYKKVYDQYGINRWVILLNKSGSWGWYYLNTQYICIKKNVSRHQQPRMIEDKEGDQYSTSPIVNDHFYHEKNISYFFDGYKNIRLYLHTDKGEVIAFLDPGRNGFNQWKLARQKGVLGEKMKKEFNNSW